MPNRGPCYCGPGRCRRISDNPQIPADYCRRVLAQDKRRRESEELEERIARKKRASD